MADNADDSSDSGDEIMPDPDADPMEFVRFMARQIRRLEALEQEQVVIEQRLAEARREHQEKLAEKSKELDRIIASLNSAEGPVEWLIRNAIELEIVLDLIPLLQNNPIVVRLGPEIDQESVRELLQEKGIPVLP